jgi:hypothetical protein
MMCFTFVDGSFIAFGSVLSNLFAPLGFGSSEITIIGIVTVVAGVMSSMGIGGYIQRKHKYRIFLRLSCWGTAIFLFCSLLTFPSKSLSLVLPNVILVGIFIVPIIPVSMNFSQEITFPMEPTVITGILMMIGQFSGFWFGIIASFLSDIEPVYALCFFGTFCAISGVCSIII